MSDVSATVEARITTPDEPGHGGRSSGDWYVLELLEARGDDTIRVDANVAVTYAAVYRAVSLISQTLASLGWHVFEAMAGDRGQKRVMDDVAWVLDTQPNLEVSAFDFRQTLVKDALCWGNGYAEIERDGFGRLMWLWRISPERVCPERDEQGRLVYEIYDSHGRLERVLNPEDVYHLRNIGPDGIVGWSTIALARRSISAGLAVDRFGERFYNRGPMPGGILTVPGNPKKEERDQMRDSFERTYGGSKNAGRVVVLTGGSTFTPMLIPNTDAQFIESKTFNIYDVARWFGVPPHKLAELGRATWGNVEQLNIEFVTDCLMPWARRLETEADLKLYGRRNRGRRWTRLNLKALLRGDSKTQTENVTKLVNGGIYTINDGREYLDLNPVPGGDTTLVQGAMIPLKVALESKPNDSQPGSPDQGGNETGGGDDPKEEGQEEAQAEAMRLRAEPFRQLLADAYGRLFRVDADKASRAAKQGKLSQHVADYFDHRCRGHVATTFRPIVDGLLLATRRDGSGAAIAEQLAVAYVDSIVGRLKARGSLEGWEAWPEQVAQTNINSILGGNP